MSGNNIYVGLITRKVLTYLLFFTTSTTGWSQHMPKALIITGNGNVPVLKEDYPPWKHEFHNGQVIQILKNTVVVDTMTDLNRLNDHTLSQYDLLISNSIFLTPTAAQLEAIGRFITNGKSLLTLHCGILSFLNWEKYEDFIGGIFIGGPSTEPATFRVNTENMEFWGYNYSFRKQEEHPVSKVVHDFDIKDELYYFQPNKKQFYVIARAENHPVMWWHPVGKGRVMSLTLGHDEVAKSNLGYKQLLINGVRWLTGIPLIYAPHLKPVSNRTLLNSKILKLNAFTHSQDTENVAFRLEKNTNPDLYTANCDSKGNLDLRLSGKPGTGTVTVSATTKTGLISSKELQISIVNDGEGNMASYLGNTVTVSSSENQSPLFAATNLVDADTATRWSSAPTDTASVVIDLQKSYRPGKVILHWEASFAKDYLLQTSATGDNWKTIVEVNNGDGGTDVLSFAPETARFVKILATKRAPGKWGYSLYEIEVYEVDKREISGKQ